MVQLAGLLKEHDMYMPLTAMGGRVLPKESADLLTWVHYVLWDRSPEGKSADGTWDINKNLVSASSLLLKELHRVLAMVQASQDSSMSAGAAEQSSCSGVVVASQDKGE